MLNINGHEVTVIKSIGRYSVFSPVEGLTIRRASLEAITAYINQYLG